jgi:hypothetical protein
MPMSEVNEFHTQLSNQALDMAIELFGPSIPEFSLPNGRIADIISTTTTNKIIIAEVKSSLKHSLVEGAIRKYLPYCNYLYIAAPSAAIWEYIRSQDSISIHQPTYHPGFMLLPPTAGVMIAPRKENIIAAKTAEYLQTQILYSPRLLREPPTAIRQIR